MRRMCRRFSTSHSVAPLHTPVDSSKKSRVRGALSSILVGNKPTHFSISARCSRLLCWRFSDVGGGEEGSRGNAWKQACSQSEWMKTIIQRKTGYRKRKGKHDDALFCKNIYCSTCMTYTTVGLELPHHVDER